jgi:iron complex transport system substrate-binding protein
VTGPARAIEVETARGPVGVEAKPAKIAVYDMAAADTLAALGVGIVGLPAPIYVPELAPLAKRAEPVGTLFEPDLEALNALGPDLVIVGSRSAAKLEAVREVAPAIDMTIGASDLIGEARRRLSAYGALFGREREAEALAARLSDAVTRASEAARGKGKALIVMTNGARVSAFGPNSRFGWIHTALGIPPAVEDLDVAVHGESVSFEFIREANPDWLIVLDRAAAIGSAEQSWRPTLDNELVAQTSAWRKGQVVALPPADVYIAAGGVDATLRVLGAIAEGFAKAPGTIGR